MLDSVLNQVMIALVNFKKEKIMVYIVKAGVDHRMTPLEIREKLTFSKTEIRRAMVTLNEKTHVQENVILSTCNRTEIFAVVECKTDGRQDIITFLVEWFQIDASEFMDYFQF